MGPDAAKRFFPAAPSSPQSHCASIIAGWIHSTGQLGHLTSGGLQEYGTEINLTCRCWPAVTNEQESNIPLLFPFGGSQSETARKSWGKAPDIDTIKKIGPLLYGKYCCFTARELDGQTSRWPSGSVLDIRSINLRIFLPSVYNSTACRFTH